MMERRAVRITPRSAITVVIENQGLPFAYGVVANISEGGACVWTNGHFEVGDRLVLRLSFARELQLFQAEGVVIWGKQQTAVRYGLQWAPVGPPSQERLRRLISTSA